MIQNAKTRSRSLGFMRTLTWASLATTALVSACDGGAQEAGQPVVQDGATQQALRMPAGPAGQQTVAQLGFVSAQLGAQGTPIYLSGQMAASIRDGATAEAAFMHSLAGTYRLGAGSGLEPAGAPVDALGHRFVHFQQTYKGIPVTGREIAVQFESDGSLTAVLGELEADLRVDLDAPRVDATAAIAKLAVRGTVTTHEKPELRVFSPGAFGYDAGPAQLAYRAVVEYFGTQGAAFEEVYVSARTGEVLARVSRVYDALARKVYDVKGKCLTSAAFLPGTLLRSEGDPAGTDKTGNNVYNHAETTYYFYSHYFGRDSYDDKGAGLTASIHATFPAGFSCSPNNAAWLAAPYSQMVYGDGDGTVLTDLSVGLDVTAHELTHAVTGVTSKLAYLNESGALNEAMSDIIGSTTATWKRSGGSITGNPAAITPDGDTWYIGKEVAGPSLPGGALRFMNNPTADGVSKDYYPERIPAGGTDNGGVHLNSGIANLAFYLMSQGGKHPRSKTAIQVSGIGMEKAARIFYLTNTTPMLLATSANFQAARNATAHVAQLLYGRCSAEWLSVQRAWDAVAVPGTYQLCQKPRDHYNF